MIGQPIPFGLVELARGVVDKVAAEIQAGGSLAYVQLVASELYQALQLELSRTPAGDPAKRGVLAAAVDQCRRSTEPALGTRQRLIQLQATLVLLQTGADRAAAAPPDGAVPRLRVIQGGLSQAG